MASSSSYSEKDYICYNYQRGKCQWGKRCFHRHDEQGLNILPAERRVTPAMQANIGAQALQTDNRWQEAEPLKFVYNSKNVKYNLYQDPFKESRIGLVQAVRSLQKSTVVKAMWISYIHNHADSTRAYFGDEIRPSHDPQEYDEHILFDFLRQVEQQDTDDIDLVHHIFEREVEKHKRDVTGRIHPDN